jgi:hypothetical protein
MEGTTVRPAARRAAAATLLTLTAACGTDPARLAAPDAAPGAPRFAAVPSSAVVVAAGGDNGAFGAGNFTATQTGPLFWASESADGFVPDGMGGFVRPTSAPMLPCNVGYFASSGMSTACLNKAANSDANANSGHYSRSWGRSARPNDAAAFLFRGSRSYTITLEGSYTAIPSEVGYFYVDGNGARVFKPIASFGAQQVNATMTIAPDLTQNRDWGFYIRNSFNPSANGCSAGPGPRAYCSDAAGSWSRTSLLVAPNQQFALLKAADDSKYLVGMEDNKLELLATANPGQSGYTGYDADYNDYMISVVPRGGDGCSPGFWTNARAANWAASGYARTATFASVFGNDVYGATATLAQVLGQNGGGLAALGRQTVAALLNAGALDGLPPANSYDLTTADVISRFNAAVPGTAGAQESLKNFFEGLTDVNGRACPLNNGNGQ